MVILVNHPVCVCVFSQPPCGVPDSCGGLCSSLVGRGTLWMLSGEVLTYIKPPRMISAGCEGSKGNTLMMLVLFMWVLLQDKRKKMKKKNWVKQEKPESPQDGQLQQEEVPHVAVTLKCLRKSAHLCVFIRLFKRSRILQIQNFRLEPVSAARSASFILTGNWAFYLGFNLQGKFFVMSTVSLIIINTMMALHSPKMHVIMEFLLILLSLSKCYVYDGFWA